MFLTKHPIVVCGGQMTASSAHHEVQLLHSSKKALRCFLSITVTFISLCFMINCMIALNGVKLNKIISLPDFTNQCFQMSEESKQCLSLSDVAAL